MRSTLGAPARTGGSENFCLIRATGKWNDDTDTANPVSGVVEVPGKSQEKTLAAKEKSLIGTWYINGDPEQTCWIAGTDRLLFAIDHNKNSSRVVCTSDGLLFSSAWKQHAEITGDKILWSSGNWWSRKPAVYKTWKKSPSQPLPG